MGLVTTDAEHDALSVLVDTSVIDFSMVVVEYTVIVMAGPAALEEQELAGIVFS